MTELLSKFDPGEIIGLVAVIGGLIVGAISMIAIYWHDLHKTEILSRLKQDMLDRGMSPEEIKTVLEAGSKTAPR